jgi:hypothetical protein
LQSPFLLRVSYRIGIILDALSGNREAWERIKGVIWRRLVKRMPALPKR